jgi:hypothetical protein
VSAYRRSLYALDDHARSETWSVPNPLVATARAWRTYERNNLLSIAIQAIFFTSLRRFAMDGTRCADVNKFGRWFGGDAAVRLACKALGHDRWQKARDAFIRKAPARDAWNDHLHEWGLRDEIFQPYRDASAPEVAAAVLVAAARLLMLV